MPRVRRGYAVHSLLLAFLLAGPATLHAEEEGEGAALETRLLRVGALTGGFEQHYGEVPPPVSAGDVASYDGFPLFGTTAEEAVYPVGQVDELIEVVKGLVEPVTWESVPGADVRSSGESYLVVRAPRKTQAAVARFVRALESRLLRTARIEVRAVHAPQGGPAAEGPARQALVESSTGPALSFLAFDSQRVSAYSGRQAAYVGGYHVMVAEEAAVSAPLVEVANLGLIADAAVSFGGDPSTALVTLRAYLSDMGPASAQPAGDGRMLEVPTFARTSAFGLLQVPVGVWTAFGGGTEWTLYVRVTSTHVDGTLAESLPLTLGGTADGRHAAHILDVRDFEHDRSGRRGGSTHVMPSNFTPPEPPELGEPAPVWPPEQLVELIREAGPRRLWEDPAGIEARNGHLIVRHTAELVGGIRRLLDVLRAETESTITATAEVHDVPAALAQRLEGRGAQGFSVPPEALAALADAQRAGQARRLGRVQLRLTPGTPNYGIAGRRRLYVGDYGGAIAQRASSSTPVTRGFFEGLRLTVTARRASTPDTIALEVEFQRTEHAPDMRVQETPCGPVQLPSLTMLRTRSGCVAKLGSTILLAAESHGERRRVVLLTPRLHPAR